MTDRMIVYQDLKPKFMEQSNSAGAGPIQLSRKWVLPPKAKSVRRLSVNESSGMAEEELEADMEEADTGAENGGGGAKRSGNYAEKRRKQNREAQRAYRQRKANKLHELQYSIDGWKQRYEGLKQELTVWKSRYESLAMESKNSAAAYESRLAWYVQENVRLKEQALQASSQSAGTKPLAKQERSRVKTETEIQYDSNGDPSCSICVDGSCICEELNADSETGTAVPSAANKAGPSEQNADLNSEQKQNLNANQLEMLNFKFQDPFLQQALDNWKPMKPVSLESGKKRANDSSNLPQFKRLKSVSIAPQVVDSTLPMHPLQIGEGPAQATALSMSSGSSSTSLSRSSTNANLTNLCNAAQIDEQCGFCSESSTCVCKEIQEEANRKACAQEPGSCSMCQNDSNGKKFCENVVNLARPSSSASSSTTDEYIPIRDAYQRIKKHMKNSNSFSAKNIQYDNLAIKGRKVQLKSVMDIIQDMNKNFI